MTVHCIVPARMGSSRYPGKPLVKIAGKEMIVRTLERARDAGCFGTVVCATDSEVIADVVTRAGFECVMTGPAQTGSDRVAEAACKLGLDLVVNLQGDEPLVEPALLAQVARELECHPDCWVTVACPLNPAEHHLNTVVKVLVKDGVALDFTRDVDERCLATADQLSAEWFQHQGVYAYSRASRDEFAALPQSSVELERSLEQMRIINCRTIRMVKSPYISISVDVPSDVAAVEARLVP
ncbi:MULTISPECIES: 3-deoxy-manno-octulosonate cytidylyltransferase [unclassified Fibrobacter]|uniref:3-deoxy-manno-octulosonate cytidylyltransferase n=1 Tax=unclassified Fibrobacter TaxID=2634177 RepID=UPI000B5280EC|nr:MULTISPECIES: NTP transferase domain-containing protein [Fibrobacter]MCL4100715.1 8-amino-3,8-dideoxy-manno-octulosonate cytidylyltransferase [Fibrobacter succinogenes]OWV08283.1 3-deoxy-manno-octulosonate cytidylyltransferase [Fibrobacter sp. UWH3]OWV13063.1 3-deoxy-manno-octulosonate cytidylyltransferase [Fibrobacter sp. UWH1]